MHSIDYCKHHADPSPSLITFNDVIPIEKFQFHILVLDYMYMYRTCIIKILPYV